MTALWNRLIGIWQGLAQTARLSVGVPDYRAYCKHMRQAHPERAPLSHAEFFRERQEARYGGKDRIRCC